MATATMPIELRQPLRQATALPNSRRPIILQPTSVRVTRQQQQLQQQQQRQHRQQMLLQRRDPKLPQSVARVTQALASRKCLTQSANTVAQQRTTTTTTTTTRAHPVVCLGATECAGTAKRTFCKSSTSLARAGPKSDKTIPIITQRANLQLSRQYQTSQITSSGSWRAPPSLVDKQTAAAGAASAATTNVRLRQAALYARRQVHLQPPSTLSVSTGGNPIAHAPKSTSLANKSSQQRQQLASTLHKQRLRRGASLVTVTCVGRATDVPSRISSSYSGKAPQANQSGLASHPSDHQNNNHHHQVMSASSLVMSCLNASQQRLLGSAKQRPSNKLTSSTWSLTLAVVKRPRQQALASAGYHQQLKGQRRWSTGIESDAQTSSCASPGSTGSSSTSLSSTTLGRNRATSESRKTTTTATARPTGPKSPVCRQCEIITTTTRNNNNNEDRRQSRTAGGPKDDAMWQRDSSGERASIAGAASAVPISTLITEQKFTRLQQRRRRSTGAAAESQRKGGEDIDSKYVDPMVLSFKSTTSSSTKGSDKENRLQAGASQFISADQQLERSTGDTSDTTKQATITILDCERNRKIDAQSPQLLSHRDISKESLIDVNCNDSEVKMMISIDANSGNNNIDADILTDKMKANSHAKPLGPHQSININHPRDTMSGHVVGQCLTELIDSVKSPRLHKPDLNTTHQVETRAQESDATAAILIKTEPISELYNLEARPFARGKFAQVKRCVRKDNASVCFAAKCIKKRRRQADIRHEILLEIEALKLSYQTKYIVKLYEVYETPTEMILLLEMARGGELQRVIDDEEQLEEPIVRRYIGQILEGLCFLHDNQIAHLDIKPQNLLLTEPYPNGDIKLCDFGISRRIAEGCEIRDICGTPDYVAPEILRYDPISLATDMWSLGVLTYVLLSGYSPFGSENKQQTFCNITQGALDFPAEIFDTITPAAVDFIRKLIVREPQSRLTSRQAMQHIWFEKTEPGI